MAWYRSYALIGLCIVGSRVEAAELISDVTSQVYESSGTAREIASRASTCIAQNLRPGRTDAPLILSTDLDNGVIVAQSALQFYAKANEWRIRSTFTLEARENRFRIKQTGLEIFGSMGSWGAITRRGVGPKAEEVFAASADVVAKCVIAGFAQDDW